MKYCDFNGCNNKIAKGAYCDEHKRKRRKRPNKNTDIYHSKNKAFYRSREWRALRAYVYEREKGLCQRCKCFVWGRRAHCHHVVPISVDVTLRLVKENIRLLCPNCHIIEENEESRATPFASYFK